MNAFRLPLVHRNVGYLSLLQVANLAVPLVTMPWVLRSLGAEAFGRVGFYQAIVAFLLLLVDFGFYLAATKRIAEIRTDQRAVDIYFSVVQFARGGLAILALLIGLAILLLVPVIEGDVLIFLAAMAALAGTWLTPMWLFAGFERMRFVAIISVTVRLASIPFVFFLIHDPADAWLYALIGSATTLAAGLLAVWLIIKHKLVTRLHRPSLGMLAEAYRDAWHHFVVNAAASLYAAGNTVILGLVSTPYQLGLFSAADKVRVLSLTPIAPVSNSYYPLLSRLTAEDPNEARRVLRRLLWVFSAGMAVVSVGLYLLAPWIVAIIMGPDFAAAVPVLRIMALVPFFIGLNTVFGTLALYVNGWKREASRVIVTCGLFNLPILAFLGMRFGAQGAAGSLLVTEVLVTCCLLLVLRRKGFSLFRTSCTSSERTIPRPTPKY